MLSLTRCISPFSRCFVREDLAPWWALQLVEHILVADTTVHFSEPGPCESLKPIFRSGARIGPTIPLSSADGNWRTYKTQLERPFKTYSVARPIKATQEAKASHARQTKARLRRISARILVERAGREVRLRSCHQWRGSMLGSR